MFFRQVLCILRLFVAISFKYGRKKHKRHKDYISVKECFLKNPKPFCASSAFLRLICPIFKPFCVFCASLRLIYPIFKPFCVFCVSLRLICPIFKPFCVFCVSLRLIIHFFLLYSCASCVSLRLYQIFLYFSLLNIQTQQPRTMYHC